MIFDDVFDDHIILGNLFGSLGRDSAPKLGSPDTFAKHVPVCQCQIEHVRRAKAATRDADAVVLAFRNFAIYLST